MFDKHTMAVLDFFTTGSRSSFECPDWPFRQTVDIGAYYANRSSSPSFTRAFRHNAQAVEREANNGCIFCSLLADALRQAPPLDDSESTELPDFDFTIDLESPWGWSRVVVCPPGSGDAFSGRFFRLYPVDSRFTSGGGLASLIRDAPAAASDEDCPRWAHELERDGRIFRALVDDCMANHPGCTQQQRGPEDSLLPSMLLRISGTPVSPSVRLEVVPQNTEHSIRYACLSYCWGGPQPGMTTLTRLPLYLKGIDLAAFPNTVLDGIRVTLSLGLEYLWVDAFCIVQDSGHGKNVELNKMSSIFAGAVCTVCAISSQAATEGFLASDDEGGPENRGPCTWYVDIQNANGDRAAVLEIRSDFF